MADASCSHLRVVARYLGAVNQFRTHPSQPTRTASMKEPDLMLHRLTLNGFKTIHRLEELELGPVNVLIGPNGAGKSNFVSFFRMLNRMMTPPGGLQLYVAKSGGASTLLHSGPAISQDIEAGLAFRTIGGASGYSFRLSHAAQDTLVFAEELLVVESAEWDWVDLGSGQREPKLIEFTPEVNSHEMMRTLSSFLQDCAVYQFHNTSETARIRQRWSVTDSQRLKEDGANLAPFLLRIREQYPAHYQRITGTLRQIAPFFADFVLEPENDTLLLRWREFDNDVVFGPHQASDGTLRAMALVALLLQPREELPAVIILDEPELGLHPRAISILAGLLQGVSSHSQVIVATQSPVLLDHFEPEQVIVAEREGAESVFRRLDAEKLSSWLEEYTLSELWDKNVLGGRPR
jgi:predicted ATPase